MSLARLLALGVLAVALGTAAAAQATKEAAVPAAPRSANPYTAFLPAGVEPDYAYWNAAIARAAHARAARQTPMRLAAVVYDEAEAAGTTGDNNTFATAELVAGFGTATDPVLTIRGDFAPSLDGVPTPTAPFPEEDGSLGDASDTGLTPRTAILVEGAVLGDGAFGATSGDFDYYAVTAPTAGLSILADIDTPTGALDPTLTLFDAAGAEIAFNDDSGGGLDSFLDVPLPGPGTYYVMVSAFASAPADPADPASGSGASSTGPYDLTIALRAPDPDVFAIDLLAGDIIGVGEGVGTVVDVEVFSPDGELRFGSAFDYSGIYPVDSPLPGAGTSFATAAVVAPTTGRYRIAVRGEGPYEIGVRGFRPRLEADPGGLVRQTIFVDFDGATIDAQALFGGGNAAAALSPLADFLADWGLDAADEDALIDAILDVLTKTLFDDLLADGNNPQTGIDILNSRDHPDPFGQPGVSRLIIGGTTVEIGFDTIGIASSIDPGNFGLEDTGVVLLDFLSAPASDPNSLNQYAVDPGATKVDLVARGVGNITAHEAGHFFGLFHTDQFNATPNLIDQGGNLPNTVGVGPDDTFGTADDVDVRFGPDVFVSDEGLRGVEDGTNALAFGLSSRFPVASAGGPGTVTVRAFPNPVAAGAPLRVEGAAAGARATLFDALGRRAATAEAGAAGALAFATAGLAPGPYFVRLDGEAARVVAVTVTVVR